MSYPKLRLNQKADYRLKHGHLWVYSNEINNKYLPLKSLQPGDLALIENAEGRVMGLAYVNPNTLICARILSTNQYTQIDKEFFTVRISNALQLREQLFTQPYYRLVYGESDFLPGLVVDRFGATLVVQVATAGMEKFLETLLSVLDELLQPTAIVVKNDSKMREVEGLTNYVSVYKGNTDQAIILEENQTKFIVPVQQGQKTGWFYDHRLARLRMQEYVKHKSVLDVFSYIGGWGVQAARHGATKVTCTDTSAFALKCVMENARLNNLDNIDTIEGDAFEVMQQLIAQGIRYDVVIIDPPAFIPKRKDLPKGSAAYQKANLLAMQLVKPQGILISGSCSMHLPMNELLTIIHTAAYKSNRQLQVLEQNHQGPDHPIHPAIPETQYLKSFIVRCL